MKAPWHVDYRRFHPKIIKELVFHLSFNLKISTPSLSFYPWFIFIYIYIYIKPPCMSFFLVIKRVLLLMCHSVTFCLWNRLLYKMPKEWHFQTFTIVHLTTSTCISHTHLKNVLVLKPCKHNLLVLFVSLYLHEASFAFSFPFPFFLFLHW